MGNVYAAFSLNDATLTGKVLADFTVDYCKTDAGADVSQIGMTLIELGAGDYALMNPNIVARTACRIHLTADSSKVAVVRFDPIDAVITAGMYDPAAVFEAFTFADATLTGKVFGDLTISYCKTLDGTDVSQTGMTLTELGLGDYVIGNPNIDLPTLCRLYLTADAAKRAVVEFSPVDAATVNPADSIRQQIVSAVAARLQTILVSNGYKTDVGAQVGQWDTTPMDQNVALYRLEYRDAEESGEYAAVGEHYHRLPIEIRILIADGTPLENIREAIADVTGCIGTDVTWGGLAEDTNQDGNWIMYKGQQTDTAAGASVKYLIEYNTAPWDPYS